jgi:hypothetical protein
VASDGRARSFGEQPVLAVPVSLVTEEPAWENDGIFQPLVCGRYERRAYEVGPFGDVP